MPLSLIGCSTVLLPLVSNKEVSQGGMLREVCYTILYFFFSFFFRGDVLLTCKKSTKNKTKQQHKSTLQKIDNISLALMKQFNLFSVARGMLTITHDQNIIYTSKYIYK